jgi:anti-sigma regulatory factor (Ser/Thr protein kinase)
MRLTLLNCPETTVRDAALLVSELATNAVRHAATPFSVGLSLEGGVVTVEVADTGGGEVARRETVDEGGRGLNLVERIAQDWGVRRRLEGKAVYFRLPGPGRG